MKTAVGYKRIARIELIITGIELEKKDEDQ